MSLAQGLAIASRRAGKARQLAMDPPPPPKPQAEDEPVMAAPAPSMPAVGSWAELSEPLRQRESGGRWDVVNPYGYAGGYQFGEAALADAGVYQDVDLTDNDWGGTFQGLGDVRTLEDFLRSPEAQMMAFNLHAQRLADAIQGSDLAAYLGQDLGGVRVTLPGLIWGAHLGGLGGLRRWLEGGGDPADAFGTRISDYVAMAMR